ncbi:MAG: hypothetical protein OXT67_09920 [Zetaproteobacteria bacterium]|nr:hypothetical protein [Zetaproteobacteria bacterium]
MYVDKNKRRRAWARLFVVLGCCVASAALGLNYERLEEKQALVERREAGPRETYHDLDLELGQISFINLNHFSRFYGSDPYVLGFGTSWIRDFSPNFSGGMVFRIKGMTATGKQQEVVVENDQETLRDSVGGMSLSFLPIQVGYRLTWRFSGENSPLAMSLWGGYEEAYFEEVREGASSTAAGLTSLGMQQLANTVNAEKSIANVGWYNGTYAGFALHCLLNGLDRRQIRSMRNTLGFQGVYFSPYVETSFAMKESPVLLNGGKNSTPVDFSYTQFGVRLSFVHNI